MPHRRGCRIAGVQIEVLAGSDDHVGRLTRELEATGGAIDRATATTIELEAAWSRAA